MRFCGGPGEAVGPTRGLRVPRTLPLFGLYPGDDRRNRGAVNGAPRGTREIDTRQPSSPLTILTWLIVSVSRGVVFGLSITNEPATPSEPLFPRRIQPASISLFTADRWVVVEPVPAASARLLTSVETSTPAGTTVPCARASFSSATIKFQLVLPALPLKSSSSAHIAASTSSRRARASGEGGAFPAGYLDTEAATWRTSPPGNGGVHLEAFISSRAASISWCSWPRARSAPPMLASALLRLPSGMGSMLSKLIVPSWPANPPAPGECFFFARSISSSHCGASAIGAWFRTL